jgi:hypothetical protein
MPKSKSGFEERRQQIDFTNFVEQKVSSPKQKEAQKEILCQLRSVYTDLVTVKSCSEFFVIRGSRHDLTIERIYAWREFTEVYEITEVYTIK